MGAAVKAFVTIMPKDGVLDPQGEAIRLALSGLGFGGVEGVRQGKLIELDLAAPDRAAAEAEVARMCRTLLANEIIESWRVEFA
jgi:phosphoribosylformylglycinamidine synthase